MRTFAVFGMFVVLLGSWSESRGQAPVLSTPFEDAASPQLIQPLNQTTDSRNRGGQSGYGTTTRSIQPVDASVGAPLLALPQGTDQPQLPLPAANGLASFGSGAAGGVTGPTSSWTAGGAAASGSMLARIANSSQASGYTSASSFAPRAIQPIGSGSGQNTSALPSAVSLQAAALQVGTTGKLLKETGAFVPGAPRQYQAGSLSGVSGPPDTATQASGSPAGSSQTSQTQPASDTDDGSSSSPLTTFSSSHMDSVAPRGFNVSLVISPTSEGMSIRLIATADGIQLVLQTKNALNGSILGDQSGISRRGGDIAEGWWTWGAGAGSWAPINVLTSSPLRKFSDPGEELIKNLVPTSKLDKTTSSADEGLPEQ